MLAKKDYKGVFLKIISHTYVDTEVPTTKML